MHLKIIRTTKYETGTKPASYILEEVCVFVDPLEVFDDILNFLI